MSIIQLFWVHYLPFPWPIKSDKIIVKSKTDCRTSPWKFYTVNQREIIHMVWISRVVMNTIMADKYFVWNVLKYPYLYLKIKICFWFASIDSTRKKDTSRWNLLRNERILPAACLAIILVLNWIRYTYVLLYCFTK